MSCVNTQVKRGELAKRIKEHLDKSRKVMKISGLVLSASEEDLQLTKDPTLQQSFSEFHFLFYSFILLGFIARVHAC